MNIAMSGSSTTLFAPLSTTSSATSTSIASPAHRRPTSLAMSTFTWFVPLCLCVCVSVCLCACVSVSLYVFVFHISFRPPPPGLLALPPTPRLASAHCACLERAPVQAHCNTSECSHFKRQAYTRGIFHALFLHPLRCCAVLCCVASPHHTPALRVA